TVREDIVANDQMLHRPSIDARGKAMIVGTDAVLGGKLRGLVAILNLEVGYFNIRRHRSGSVGVVSANRDLNDAQPLDSVVPRGSLPAIVHIRARCGVAAGNNRQCAVGSGDT